MDSSSAKLERMASLLAIARGSLNEGQPSLALQAVVEALRVQGGETAVHKALYRARTIFHTGVDSSPEADELSILFAQCALAETAHVPESMPNYSKSYGSSSASALDKPVPKSYNNGVVIEPYTEACDLVVVGGDDGAEEKDSDTQRGYQSTRGESRVPILAESGRLQVVADASADGSSFTCRHCGGLVSNFRRKEHYKYWCINADDDVAMHA